MINWQPGITLDDIEKEVILKALSFYHGNKTRTAEALGIAIRTIDNKLAKYRGDVNNEDLFEPEEDIAYKQKKAKK